MSTQTQHSYTLLIVDDEPDILDSIQRLFRGKHTNILTATSPAQALKILQRTPVHLVMSDQYMPEMTGVEFLTILHDQYPEIIRILFTGYTDPQSVIEAINSGHIYGYIAKPWDPRELKTLIDRALEHYTVIRERDQLLRRLKHKNEEVERINAQLSASNTSLKSTMDEMKTLDRLKTIFMEIISHELNTPTSIILGYTFLLQQTLQELSLQNTPTPATLATLQNGLHSLDSASSRLKSITDRVFQALHSSDSPSLSMKPETFSLRPFFEKLRDTLRPFLSARSQTLVLEVDPIDLEVTLDPSKIHDALYNLLTNAIKFSHDNNHIHLTAALSQRDEITIQVIDQGVGIDPKDQPQIFASFFGTFDSWHHSSGDFEFGKRGIGVGLTIAQRFIQLHNGSIHVSSEVDRGTIFTIKLPTRFDPVHFPDKLPMR